jgi:uncharacterized protein
MIAEPWQWILALLSAVLIGVAKAGITGLSILSIVIFNHIFVSAKQTSGLILPLLIFGDVVAVYAYWRHTLWSYVWRLFPWTAAGVVMGYFTLGHISDHMARVMIGLIIVGLAALSLWRRGRPAPAEDKVAHTPWPLAALIGMVAGFITLIANAAGPLMAIYLVAMRLPKMQYVGTSAVFFMLLNLFKVPFMVDLGLITTQSFGFNLAMAPAVWIGVFGGRRLLKSINQSMFDKLVLALSAVGGIMLLVS